MLEDHIGEQCSLNSFSSYSASNDYNICLSRETSFFETKISSKDFQLEYNKAFKAESQTLKEDMGLCKGTSNSLFDKVSLLLLTTQSGVTDSLYQVLSERLSEISQITDREPSSTSNDEEYAQALIFKSALVNKMIEYVEANINSESL